MESCTQALSILSRVWKVILDTRLIVEYFARYRTHTRVEYGKLYSSYEYVESSMGSCTQALSIFESSMGSCTQALSILSRVWKVILDTRLIVEYLPDTVLILE